MIAYENAVSDSQGRLVFGLAPVESTINYGQNLRALSVWCEENLDTPLNYAGLAHFPPLIESYGLPTAYPPERFGRTDRFTCVIDLQTLYHVDEHDYSRYRDLIPHAVIEKSLLIYRVGPETAKREALRDDDHLPILKRPKL